MIVKIISLCLPWFVRRRLLQSWFGYKIHPTAKIGLAWVFPVKLTMEEGTRIDHFNVAVNLDRIEMKRKSKIGRGNWITGFPLRSTSKHFQHQTDRRPELFLGEESAITKNHHLDCTDRITIGRFTTIAGYQSQLLTHSIDVLHNRQDSAPITIGEYCFVGTNVVILGGASLPSRSVLGAKSLLNKSFSQEWMLYGGVPAKAISDVPKEAGYFTRTDGFVL
jgi:acetyltransferase-like isoleucine patch superfamily enzyme